MGTNDIKYYYIGGYMLKCILILDMFVSSLNDLPQTVIYYLFAAMFGVLLDRLSSCVVTCGGRVFASGNDGIQSGFCGYTAYDTIVIAFINCGDKIIIINAVLIVFRLFKSNKYIW